VHPGGWLIWALGGGVVALSTTNPFYLLPLFAVAWVIHAACRRSGPGARSFRYFALFGLGAIVTRTALVLLGPVTPESVVTASIEGLRLAVLLAVYGTFNSVCDPLRLLRLAPRRFHEPALAAALALSIAPRTIEAAAKVREAQRVRGIDTARWRAGPALAVPVLETGMEEAVTLAESMDARGHGRGPRSRYRPEPFDRAAWSTAAISVASALAFVFCGVTGTGGLSFSSFPLQWPEASAWLVAATLALAAPAGLARYRAGGRLP
jgi:energy-coupling factor transport system permease protein